MANHSGRDKHYLSVFLYRPGTALNRHIQNLHPKGLMQPKTASKQSAHSPARATWWWLFPNSKYALITQQQSNNLCAVNTETRTKGRHSAVLTPPFTPPYHIYTEPKPMWNYALHTVCLFVSKT